MAIDVDTPQSVGWWMLYLWKKLQAEKPRYDELEAYRSGHPPLPKSLPDSLKAATRELIQMSQFNVADLIVQALVERLGVRAIRTSASDDANGDSVAMSVWNGAGMPTIEGDVYQAMAGMSVGYVATAVDEDGTPVATFLDPRETIAIDDPINPSKTRVAFRIYHDEVAQRDYAILWLPGKKWIASRPVKTKAKRRGPDGLWRPVVSFSPALFDLHPVEGTPESDDFSVDPEMLSEQYEDNDVHVTAIRNRDGKAEIEIHRKHIDQINHIILQGVMTAVFQAFKQRALEVANGEALPDTDPDTGETIDYDDLLSADPGAIWRLPVGAKIWESGQVDMTGIITLAEKAIQRLFAATRTPFSMGTSDATNQSAEGAQNTQLGLVFKAENRQTRATPRLARVESQLLRLAGHTDRADPTKILIVWRPPQRYSLSEMSTADSAAVSLPDEEKWERIYLMTPDEVEIASTRRAAQQLRDAALAASATSGQPVS